MVYMLRGKKFIMHAHIHTPIHRCGSPNFCAHTNCSYLLEMAHGVNRGEDCTSIGELDLNSFIVSNSLSPQRKSEHLHDHGAHNPLASAVAPPPLSSQLWAGVSASAWWNGACAVIPCAHLKQLWCSPGNTSRSHDHLAHSPWALSHWFWAVYCDLYCVIILCINLLYDFIVPLRFWWANFFFLWVG